MTERILSDEDIRYLVISGLTAPTARDKQVKAGASDLANGCDRCVARSLAGVHYETSKTRRTWMGAVIGTAIHKMMEPVAERVPDARAERHVVFGHINGYGDVGGTIDLDLLRSILDYKGSTRKKIALLRDFISMQATGEPVFGRKEKHIAGPGRGMMPQSEYDKEMAAMVHKVTSYFGQAQLYMRGHGNASQASLVFIARDGNGWYEVADLNGYDDMTKQHDIFVLTFAYNPEYAQSLMDRAQSIWDALSSGMSLGDFPMHDDCFTCMDLVRAQKKEEAEAAEAQHTPGEPVLVPMDMEEAA